MTPLGMRQYLWLRYPELEAVEVSLDNPFTLTVHVVPRKGAAVPPDIEASINKVRTASWEVHVAKHPAGTVLPPGHYLTPQGTSLPLAWAEDENINWPGINELMSSRWPTANPIGHEAGFGKITISVDPFTSDEQREDIRRSLQLLTTVKIEISDHPLQIVSKPSSPSRHPTQDWAILHEYVHDAFAGHLPQELLPERPVNGGYLSRDCPTNIYYALSLFEHLYVEIPLGRDEFPGFCGVQFPDFLEAVSLGRVIPVFTAHTERYDAQLVAALLERAEHVLLPGELRLRQLDALGQEHLMARMLVDSGDELRESFYRAVESQPSQSLALHWIYEIERDIALRARRSARYEPSMATALYPLARSIDDTVRRAFGLNDSRYLELTAAFHAKSVASALKASLIVAPDLHQRQRTWAVPYIEFVSGVLPGNAPNMKVPAPRVMDGLLLYSPQQPPLMSLREFAHIFRGGAITRMRQIIQDPKLWSDDIEGILKRYNQEVRAVNGSLVPAASVSLAASLAGLGTSGIGKLLGRLAIQMLRPVMDRVAPTQLDKIDAWLTGVPPESVSLARVRRLLT